METKIFTLRRLFLVVLLYSFTSINVFAQGKSEFLEGSSYPVMHVVEVSFTSQATYNASFTAYMNVDVWVNLNGPGGKAYKIPVFWDGGNDFRARLVATSTGTWNWSIDATTVANADQGFLGNNVKNGSFIATSAGSVTTNANNQGFIRVAANNRTLEYADGTGNVAPFFYTADTSWAILTDIFDYNTNSGVSDISFTQYINARKNQGFNGMNVIASFPSDNFTDLWASDTHHKKKGNGAWPFELKNSGQDVDYLKINPNYWQSVDERMQHLADQGFVTLFETVRRSERWRDGTSAEKDAFYNYVRYLWARYGCYNMIFSWVHHDSQGSIYPKWLPLVQHAHDELSAQLGDQMPYGQPRTAMSYNTSIDNWEKDIPDALDIQNVSNAERDETMHEWLSEIYHDWDKHHTLGGPKPALNLEPYYPGWGSHSSNEINPGLNDITMGQMQMYGSVLSGGLAGHAWGDTWYAGAAHATQNRVVTENSPQVNSLNSFESQAMGHLKTFILDSGHEYERLVPAAHTNLSNSQNFIQTLSISNDKKFALGFFTTSYNVPNLTNLIASETYRFEWWDVTNGGWISAGDLTTTSSGQLAPPARPDNSKNWAYRIRSLDYINCTANCEVNLANSSTYQTDSGWDSSGTYSVQFVHDENGTTRGHSDASTVAGAEVWIEYTLNDPHTITRAVIDEDNAGNHYIESWKVQYEDPVSGNFVDAGNEGFRQSQTSNRQEWDFDDVSGVTRFRLVVVAPINSGDPLAEVETFELYGYQDQNQDIDPIANAGADQTIELPTNSVLLSGSGSDPDGGTITGYQWTKLSGPSATLSGASTSTLTASNLLEGSYTFRLTVTDDEGDTASDDVMVLVDPISNPNDFVLRINAGGSSSATYQGNTFIADNQNGYTFSSDSQTTTGSSAFILAQPFKSVRFTKQQQIEYLIPVSNGVYEVILHFAEPYHGVHPGTNPDTRKFNVDIEGTRIQTDLNIISEVGANAVYTINEDVSVSDGQLSLVFSQGSGNDPIINAIEILGIDDNQPASGLVGHWPLDEQNGTTAGDVSGQNHDGSLVNGITFDNDSGNGQIGDALIFDGPNDRINLPDIDNDLQAGFSVVAWINPENTNGYRAIAGTHTSQGFMTFVHNGKLAFALRTDSGTRKLKSHGTIVVNQWQHIAATYDGTVMTWYIDGVEVGSEPHTGQVSDRNNGYIGWSGWSSEYFDGGIDDVRLYDNSLSNSQINDLYNGGQSPLPDSAGHWPLDEQNGTTAGDVSGQNHDGSLVNGITFDNDSGNGQIGDALIFDGSNDRINLPDIDNDLQAGFSVVAWINPENTNGYRAIAGTHTSQGFMTFVHNGKLAFALRTDSGTRKLKSHGTIVVNQWQHIAATYDGTVMTWYIDGVEVGSEPHTGQVSDRNNGYIGWSGWSSEYFDGGIDDVRLYDNSLTEQQVVSLFEEGDSGSSNLTAKVDLDFESNGKVYAHPNPSTGKFRISGIPVGEKKISVSDFSGRLLLKMETDKDEPVLNLLVYPKALYLVKVIQNRSEWTFKVARE